MGGASRARPRIDLHCADRVGQPNGRLALRVAHAGHEEATHLVLVAVLPAQDHVQLTLGTSAVLGRRLAIRTRVKGSRFRSASRSAHKLGLDRVMPMSS